jgi:hypothetical protein
MPLRHRLGHVEPRVSEGPPCEACYAEAGQNEFVNGLASNTTQKRLKTLREPGLGQPQLQATLTV